MQKKAFTLIELLVVIAIIAILAAILFPVFAQAKAAASQTTNVSNLKQINLAAQMYLADNDDKFMQGDDYAEWIWMFLLGPYIKGQPADFTQPRGNIYFNPLVPATQPQYLSDHRAVFLRDSGLAAQWKLTPTTDPDGAFAYAFWATYSINEHNVQEWPDFSSYADPANTFMFLEANDTEIEGDELRKLYGRTVNCPGSSFEDLATRGGHAGGLAYAWADGHVKSRKTGWSTRTTAAGPQCDYTFFAFPQGGRGGTSTTPNGSGVRPDCGEWTAPADKLDASNACVAN